MIGNSEVGGAVIDFDPYNSRSFADPSHQLGSLYELNDYRAFRHGKVGAANTSLGKLSLAPAPVVNHVNMSVTASPAGVNSIVVTPGATAAAAGIYDEGVAFVTAGPGAGQHYRVSHNPPITASTAFTLALSDTIQVALTASSKVSLAHNPYNGGVEAAVQTRRALGVPLISLTAAFEGWYQSKGASAVLNQGTVAVGSLITGSGSVAGAVAAVTGTYATDLVAVAVGQALIIAGVDTEYRPMVLTID